jgi:hypothetical protein
VSFPFGETVELQHDTNLVRHHQRLDLAPQAAQAQRHHRPPQLWRAADVAAFVKRHVDLKPVAAHRPSSASNVTISIAPKTSAAKFQSVDQRMRLECGVGFRQLRTCRRTRPGQLCADFVAEIGDHDSEAADAIF